MISRWTNCRPRIHLLLRFAKPVRPTSSTFHTPQDVHVHPTQIVFKGFSSLSISNINEQQTSNDLELQVENVIEQLTYPGRNRDSRITLVHIDKLMESLSRLNSIDAAEQAELLLKCLESNYEKYSSRDEFLLIPNAISYNHVIHAYAVSNGGIKAADKCEELLDHMLKRCRHYVENTNDNRKPPPEPLITTFNSVMNAIAKSNDENSGKRAESVFKKMEQWSFDCIEHRKSLPNFPYNGVKPNSRSLAIVLDCWANAKSDESFDRAVTIFEHAIEKLSNYNNSENENGSLVITVNIVMLNAVLKVLVSSRKGRIAAKKAEELVSTMKELHENGTLVTKNSMLDPSDQEALLTNPNVRTYTLLLNCWANAVRGERDVDCAQHAENILYEMEQLYQKGEDVMPNYVSYSTCLNAWSKIKSDVGGEHALKILDRLEEMYRITMSEDLKPNSILYNSCLNALCASQNRQLYENARDLLEKMENHGLANTTSYNTLMKWHVSNDPLKAYDAVSGLFSRMKDRDIIPDDVTYNTLIDACGKSNHEHISQRVVEILDEMMSLSKSNPNFHPTTVTFTTILNIISRSKTEEKVDPARKIFRQLLTIHETRDDDRVKPDIRCFSAFISACSNQGGSDERKRVALKTAIGTYEQLCKQAEYGKPNSFIYGGLMKCCGRLTNDGAERERLLSYLFNKCKSEGQVNKSVIQILIKSCSKESRIKILGPDIEPNRFPREWSANISK
jgi:hypothetical protein